MKSYNALVQDAYNNAIQVFVGADEETWKNFLTDYCDTEEYAKSGNLWLKYFELPELGIPYRCQGWLVKFTEIES